MKKILRKDADPVIRPPLTLNLAKTDFFVVAGAHEENRGPSNPAT